MLELLEENFWIDEQNGKHEQVIIGTVIVFKADSLMEGKNLAVEETRTDLDQLKVLFLLSEHVEFSQDIPNHFVFEKVLQDELIRGDSYEGVTQGSEGEVLQFLETSSLH